MLAFSLASRRGAPFSKAPTRLASLLAEAQITASWRKRQRPSGLERLFFLAPQASLGVEIYHWLFRVSVRGENCAQLCRLGGRAGRGRKR